MIIIRTFVYCDVRGCLAFIAAGFNSASRANLQDHLKVMGWVEICSQGAVKHICPCHDDKGVDDLVYDVSVGEAV